MVPHLYELKTARALLPQKLTSAQRIAIHELELEIQNDPYRQAFKTVGFSYKCATYGGVPCLYTRANKNGMIFDVFYRVVNDDVEIVLIYFK